MACHDAAVPEDAGTLGTFGSPPVGPVYGGVAIGILVLVGCEWRGEV